MRLQGRRALITGAASGAGLAIASAFAREGARLLLFDIDGAAVGQVSDRLREDGAEVEAVAGSVAQAADVAAALARMDELFGGIDILVNNAGITANTPTLELTDEVWDRTLGVNLRGPFMLSRGAGLRMIEQGDGVIVNLSSIFGIVAAPERAAYCVSKAAVAMLTKVLAIEWGGRGVRVNALAPGYINTPGTEDLIRRGRLDVERLKGRTPLGRLADPAEIADSVVFLCSPAAAYITGQVLGVDGGWTANGYL